MIKLFGDFFMAFIGMIANIFTIGDSKKGNELLKKIRANKKVMLVLASIACIVASLIFYWNYRTSISVTQVMLSQNSLFLNIGDEQRLTATVLYSDNSKDNSVLWISGNEAVASVGTDGMITALAEGTTIITAQASRNNTTESAVCEVMVTNMPNGYSISVSPSSLKNYYYIRITPFDDDITNIQIYAESPSGKIFAPKTDENDLYHFYSESGKWTIYASLESKHGIYEAYQPEDFVTIDVDVDEPLDPYNLLPQIFP